MISIISFLIVYTVLFLVENFIYYFIVTPALKGMKIQLSEKFFYESKVHENLKLYRKKCSTQMFNWAVVHAFFVIMRIACIFLFFLYLLI